MPTPNQPSLRRPTGAALAVTALALSGLLAACGLGSGADHPKRIPFGRSPGGTSPADTATGTGTGTAANTGTAAGTSTSTGGTALPTFTLGLPAGIPSGRPSATHVTPSSSPSPCPEHRPARAKICMSFHMVYPTIDPAAPCVDLDFGVYRGKSFICLVGAWTEVPFFPSTSARPAG